MDLKKALYIFFCLEFLATACLATQKTRRQPKAPAAQPDTAQQTQARDTDSLKRVKNDTAKAVTYQSVESETSKKIYINDTTFFSVSVTENGYKTILLGNEKDFSTDKDLDNF